MSDGDHLIWSNHHIDYEDWREYMESEFPELTEDERYDKMLEINDSYLDDERMNLNIQLSEPIILIADLGLWNGRHSGDLRCDDVHHDGTNHYLYRVFKNGTTDQQQDNLEEKILSGTATRSDITRVTKRLGDEIGRVYGWDIPSQQKMKSDRAR